MKYVTLNTAKVERLKCKHGFTNERLAEMAGLTPETISRYFALSEKKVFPRTAYSLARCLNVEVSEILAYGE